MEMNPTTKAILINGAIVVGLLLEHYWGRSLNVLLISALLLFLVANMMLFIVFRRQRRR